MAWAGLRRGWHGRREEAEARRRAARAQRVGVTRSGEERERARSGEEREHAPEPSPHAAASDAGAVRLSEHTLPLTQGLCASVMYK
eukprot:1079708-Rhodomonas_salina.1